MTDARKEDVDDYLQRCGLDLLLDPNAENLPREDPDFVERGNTAALGPQWSDLVTLHRLIRRRRVTTILEFGCGWSTLVMAHALRMNREEFGGAVGASLRRNNPFEIHSVDDMPEFIEVARGRLPEDLTGLVTFLRSEVCMTTFADRICTEYHAIPNISPDLIYLDAPSQDSALGSVSGITTAHPDRVPMSCDILKIEHFLLPGTLLVVDGRTANARFLRSNFQRHWNHEHDTEGDVHYFELVEQPLGRYNQAQIEFCLGSQWLTSVER